jgi:hypothetical protein
MPKVRSDGQMPVAKKSFERIARGVFEKWHRLIMDPEKPLNGLDKEYYAEKPDVFEKLCKFIEEHSDELAHHVTSKPS